MCTHSCRGVVVLGFYSTGTHKVHQEMVVHSKVLTEYYERNQACGGERVDSLQKIGSAALNKVYNDQKISFMSI
jgi:Ser-tRNA(Ala) deacylase AlaX